MPVTVGTIADIQKESTAPPVNSPETAQKLAQYKANPAKAAANSQLALQAILGALAEAGAGAGAGANAKAKADPKAGEAGEAGKGGDKTGKGEDDKGKDDKGDDKGEDDKGDKAGEDSPPMEAGGLYDSTSLKRWQVQILDYNVYWILTACLGWFGIDYWYLGAPLTGVLKLLVNFSTIGYWWIYDIMNATFNRPTIELFGPTMPFFGTTGCAAGRFRNPEKLASPDLLSKHFNYIIYGVVLVFLGIIGGDSFVLGNTLYAFIRIFCLITIIGAPIAIVWWLYNLFNYLFCADYFMDDAWYYLGAASPTGRKCPPSLLEQLLGPFGSLFEAITGFKFPTPDPLETWQKLLLSKSGLSMSNVMKLDKAFPKKPCDQQTGGAEQTVSTVVGLSSTNTHLLSLLFAGTIGFIVVSSIILSLRRSYQNGNKKSSTGKTDDEQRRDQENDDVPPQPRVPRVTPKNA